MERVAETAELLGLEASIGTKQVPTIGHATKDFIAGAISGMVGICAGQPLDTLRVRLQQRSCPQQTSTASILRASGAKAGMRDLFRGMSYPLYTIALQNAVTFQAQGAAARMLTGSDSRAVVSWQHTCISGMFAGAMSSFISSPTELLKIRMQLQKPLPGTPGYHGPLGMLQQVVRQDGILGLTRGLGMTLLRDTPSYGVYFCVYHFAVQGLGRLMYPAADPRQQQQEQEEAHTTQQRLVHTEQQQQQSAHTEQPLVVQASSVWEGAEQPVHRLSLVQQPPQLMQQQQQHAHLEQEPQQQQQEQRQQQQPQKQVNPGASQPLVQFIAGGLAGAIAWMSIYPIDVIKCRMQAASRLTAPYSSALDCAVTSWRQEGPRVFVRGLGATMGRGFVVNAAIFAAFEACIGAMSPA